MNVSKCCLASLKVRGDVTHFYICAHCKLPCDPVEFSPSPTKTVRIVKHFKDGDRIDEVQMNRKDRRRFLKRVE
jgi:hypothetical protein